MSEDHLKDIDSATAAEQSSEEDEAQEGNILNEELHGSDAAGTTAMHVVDDDATNDDPNNDPNNDDESTASLDAANDVEADAVVEDALDIDSMQEADASVAATSDESESWDEEHQDAGTVTGTVAGAAAESEGDVTPFFWSESYESRLAASLGWQEDCEDHDQEKEAAFARANRSENPGR